MVDLNEIGIVDNIELLFENKVVLYGAGYYGKIVYNYIKSSGIDVIGFCDSNKNDIVLSKDEKVRIMSPEELKALCDDEKIIVIITVKECIDDILISMDKFNIIPYLTVTMYAVGVSLAVHDDYNGYEEEFYNKHKLNVEIWRKALEVHLDSNKDKLSTYKACHSILNSEGVIIYQPGKVGSSSIKASLDRIGVECTQLHKFQCEDDLIRKIVNCSEKIKIITGVRSPIKRDISAFFQLLTRWLLVERKDLLGQGLFNAFNTIYSNSGEIEGVPLTWNQFDWFDKELKRVFGVNVYEYLFDIEKGFSVIKKGNIEIFVYKLEKLNKLENEIGIFLGIEKFKLINNNTGGKKEYNYMYQEFLNNIIIDDRYIQKYINDYRVSHFYSKKELMD